MIKNKFYLFFRNGEYFSCIGKNVLISFSIDFLEMLDLWASFDKHEIKGQQFWDDHLIEPNQVLFDKFGKSDEIP